MSDAKVSAILINSKPYTLEMLEADKKSGRITAQEYDRRKALFSPAPADMTIGTIVEQSAGKKELTQAQKNNEGAKKAVDELGETARRAKIYSEFNALFDSLKGKKGAERAAILEQIDEYYEMYPGMDFGKPAIDAARKDAAQFKKVATTSGNGRSEDIYKNAENATVVNFHLDAPTETVKVEKKGAVKKRIKANATYTDAAGIEHRGKAELGKVQKQLKTDVTTLSKEFDKTAKDYRNAVGDEAVKAQGKKLADLAVRMYEANAEYVVAKAIYKTSKGRGVGKRAKAVVANEKAENRIALRTQVFQNKATAEAAIKANPALKGHVGVLPKDGGAILSGLKALAESHYRGEKTSLDEVFTDKNWEDLRNIKLPKESNAQLNEADTRATQRALRALAGGDSMLSPSEKKALMIELNKDKKGHKITRTDLNRTFTAYGLEHENRLKYKAKDAGNDMLKAVPGAAIAATAMAFTKAVSHATAESTAHATTEELKHIHEEVIATAIAHAEASVPGLSFTTIDPETGEEILKRIAGQFSEDTQTAVATALIDTNIKAVAEAHAHAKAEAHAEASTSWGKAALGAGIAVATAGIIGFFASHGYERGVNKGQVSKEFKDVEFIKLHKKSAQGLAAELIQERNKLAKKMGGNVAAANMALADAYRQYEGVQNGTMTLRELQALRDKFGAFVEDYKDTPVEPPKAPKPKEKPVEVACDVDINKTVIEIKHQRRAGDTWGGIVNAYYPDCVKVHGEKATIRALKEALATSEDGVRDEAKFKALLRGTDIPKLMKLPMELLDCEINKDGAVEARKFRTGGKSNNMEVGRGNTRYKAQDCDDNKYTGKSASEVEDQVRKNNQGKKINIHVNE